MSILIMKNKELNDIEIKVKLDLIQYNFNIIKKFKGEEEASKYAERKFNELFK